MDDAITLEVKCSAKMIVARIYSEVIIASTYIEAALRSVPPDCRPLDSIFYRNIYGICRSKIPQNMTEKMQPLFSTRTSGLVLGHPLSLAGALQLHS